MKDFRFLLFLTAFFFFASPLQAQITGFVFRDLNSDGIYQPSTPNNEYGVGGIKIKIYDGNNVAIDSTISAANGSYTLPFTIPVRLEFEFMLPTACLDSSVDFNTIALAGDNVRFIPTASNSINYGIQAPEDYQTTPDPTVFISRFARGNPLVAGTSSTADAFYGYPYSNTTFSPVYTLHADAVGSIWGNTYSRQAKKIFASAFLKRQCGLGPMGSGGIYLLEPNGSTFTVTNFYDMDANGHRTRASAGAIPYGVGSSYSLNAANTEATYLGPLDPLTGLPEGLGVIGTNVQRGLPADISLDCNDPAALDQVGKVGLGDLDISADGRFLFVTNLYSRLIYRLELDNPFNPTSVVHVDSFALPSSIIANHGVLRCFGLCYRRGQLYIGAVTTGENGGVNVINGATDVYAYVFKLSNALGNTPVMNATPVISFPLNYLKGFGLAFSWHPWNKNTQIVNTNEYPCPMLSDIEFTDRGDMIIDLCDRNGHQFMISNYRDLAGTFPSGDVVIGGDILMAGFDCTTGGYVLENNGSFSSNGTNYTSGGVGNNQGPGGGEFFFHDAFNTIEIENSVGSCAVVKGRDEVILSLMDPNSLFTNGSVKFSTTTGLNSCMINMATIQEMGKANSMGDIEVAGDRPNLQIGNRVWNDSDADGIQDPDEPGIADVTIELLPDFDINGVPDGGALASTQTNNAGYYYFDVTNVPDGDPVVAGAQPGPIARRNYIIRVGIPDWNVGVGVNDLDGFTMSVTDIGGPGQPDVRDNDALMLSNIPTIDSVQVYKAGNNTHAFDFGFVPCAPVVPSDITINCANPSLMIGPSLTGNYEYSWSPGTGLSATNIAQPLASPTSTTTYTLTINKLCTYVYTAFVDTDPPEAHAGLGQSLSCEEPGTVIGSPSIGTNTYSWSPGNSLDDSTKAQPIATPKATTQYTLTVTGMNGCKTYDYVTIERDPCCARIVVPNSFTPNKDGLNDEFGVIVIENVETFFLTIYDRWGNKVFETDDPDQRWNGMIKNKDADLGTYFYYIKYNCHNFTEPRFIKGDISLVR